jgi:plastocyanin
MKRIGVLMIVVILFAACGGGGTTDTASGGDDSGTTESPSPDESDEAEEEVSACLSAPSAKTKLAVNSVDFAFKPTTLRAPAGEDVTVVLNNKGAQAHSFTVSDLECNTGSVAGGTKVSVTFTMPDVATEFTCIFHENMTGKLAPT